MATTEPAKGLVPAPVDRSYLKGQEIAISGEGAGVLPSIYESPGFTSLGDAVGMTYDLRDQGKLTGIRDQGNSGSCWAFATYSSLESYLMPGELRDFSENNLKNTHGFDPGANDGGNELMSTAYLVRWSGPVNEADDPFVASSTYSPSLPAQMHVQDVLFIPGRANSTDNDNLKQAIQTYGAVYTSCYWDSSYFNSITHSYYYASTGSNHAIALVGWNDSYSRSNFASTPPGDGAFIARNSWGSGWGDGGYFYLSYYDRIAGTSNAVFTAQPAQNYNHIYQHDPLGWTGNLGYGSDAAWFAANYTAISDETLSAVGFYAPQVNSDYQVYIYGNNVLAGTKTGTLAVPGYHTVPLDMPVTLTAGEQFRVAVRLHTPAYNFPVCTESRYIGYSSGATSNASESFISSNGVAWTDIGADSHGNPTGTDVCLKAYTTVTKVESLPPIPPTWPLLEFGGQLYNVSENAVSVPVTVHRNGSTTLPSTVGYSVTGGNATAGTDYTGGAGTLNFAPGATTATFNVAIVNDAVYEGNETVVISLSNPLNATLGTVSNTTIVIMDDDARPVLSFGAWQYSASEGAGKITMAVNLVGGTAFPASVGYSVTGGNATAGTDYTGGAGTLNFAPGTTTATFDVNIVNDAVYEGNENIIISLSNPVNATLGSPSTTTATIIDEDAQPTLQFSSAAYSVQENAGIATIMVNLAGSTVRSAAVNYAITGGNATTGTDYTGGSGTLNFTPGTTTATFNVNVVNDAVYEGNENIVISLSSPVNATLGSPSTTTATIVDDDAPPTLQFSQAAYTVRENAGALSIQVSLAGSTSLPSSVSYAVTGGNATAGTDYTGGSGTLNFAPGATSAAFNVNIVNDAVYEGNENIIISLSNPVNATLGTPATTTATITNDDTLPVLQFTAAQYSGNENAGALSIQVSLAGSTSLPSSVSYAITGGNATAGNDYTGGSGTLNLAPGTTTATFSVNMVNDAVYEGNENIVISLSNPVNATLGSPATTTATIVDDDAPPTLQFSQAAYSVRENASIATITVNLAGSTARSAAVNYAVTGGNATAGTDYAGGSGTLNFAAGATTATFNVNVVDNGAYNGNRTIILSLSNQKNATLGTPATTTITIVDDELPVTLEMYDISLVAGWNLISIPLSMQNNSIAGIFPQDVRSGIVDIWGWDEALQNWVYYSPDPGDYFYQYYPALTGLDTGKAYWVEMNKSATIVVQGTVPGSAPASPIALVPGWNFVGPTGCSSFTPATMYTNAVDVWGWDEAAQNWIYYSPDANDYFYQYYQKVTSVRPGHGYWVEMA